MPKWELPQGMTLEELDAYAMKRESERRSKWAKDHPEKIIAQRIVTYSNFLRKHGYIVTEGGSNGEV